MSPAPVDCFEYAQMAASKMLIPGTSKQPAEERKRMVQEILNAESTDYPSERGYKKVRGLLFLLFLLIFYFSFLPRQATFRLASKFFLLVPLAQDTDHHPGSRLAASCLR